MKISSVLQGSFDEQTLNEFHKKRKRVDGRKKLWSVLFFSLDSRPLLVNSSLISCQLLLTSRKLSLTSRQLSMTSRQLSLTSCQFVLTSSRLVQYSRFKLTFFHELDTEQSILCTQANSVCVYDRRTKCLLDLYIGLDDLLCLVHLLYIKHEVANKDKFTE